LSTIPDVPFPVLLSTLIKSRFQAKPATLFIRIDFPFLFAVEELYGTRYQCGSFSLVYVGSGSHCLRSFSFFLFTQATTVKVWVWVLRHTTPLTHIIFSNCLRGGGLPGAGTYVAPSLNHAGCVITTSRVFSFSFLFP
jgi:hypothetical protein